MNAFWSFFWPLIGAGLVLGVITGAFGFRVPRQTLREQLTSDLPPPDGQRRKRWLALAVGTAAVLGATAVWSGPMGAAAVFAHRVERDARITLDNYEMLQVSAQLHRAPLSRRLMLSGVADDFQRSELVRIMGSIPGVREARWSATGGGLPLFAEGFLAAFTGFLFGLLLAYLVELRRRYNAQWNW